MKLFPVASESSKSRHQKKGNAHDESHENINPSTSKSSHARSSNRQSTSAEPAASSMENESQEDDASGIQLIDDSPEVGREETASENEGNDGPWAEEPDEVRIFGKK